MPIPQVSTLPIERFHGETAFVEKLEDQLAIEEPLEIRIGTGAESHRSLSITMRTPGHDAELALGFLWTEGLLDRFSQVDEVFPCGPTGNVVRVQLREGVRFDWQSLDRHFYTTSSCGVCGKSSIEALRRKSRFPITKPLRVSPRVICELPAKLREAQRTFAVTGGLHAAALVSPRGHLLALREDVGRHNALDKLIGYAGRESLLPLDEQILVLSGRASFELIQKATMAGIPVVVAMGAPSSLAVKLAEEAGITLIGFAKADRFNVYTGRQNVGEHS